MAVTVAQHVHHGVVLVKPTSYAGINEQNAAEVLLLPWSKPQWIHRKKANLELDGLRFIVRDIREAVGEQDHIHVVHTREHLRI